MNCKSKNSLFSFSLSAFLISFPIGRCIMRSISKYSPTPLLLCKYLTLDLPYSYSMTNSYNYSANVINHYITLCSTLSRPNIQETSFSSPILSEPIDFGKMPTVHPLFQKRAPCRRNIILFIISICLCILTVLFLIIYFTPK